MKNLQVNQRTWGFSSSTSFSSLFCLGSSCKTGSCSTPGLCRGVALGVTRGEARALLVVPGPEDLRSAVEPLADLAELGVDVVLGFFGVLLLWTFGRGGFESFCVFESFVASVEMMIELVGLCELVGRQRCWVDYRGLGSTVFTLL